MVVCDVDNAWSNRWWDAIGPNEFKVTDATILDEPADPVYKLWSSVTAVAQDGSNNIYPNSNIVVTSKIKNSGGYGDGSFALIFFTDQNQVVGNSNVVELSLEKNETKEIQIVHRLTYPRGSIWCFTGFCRWAVCRCVITGVSESDDIQNNSGYRN